MAIELKVTPQELKNAANDISNQIRSVEQAFAQVERAINDSASYWEGDAGDHHRKYYKEVRKEVDGILKLLKNRPDDLLKMAGLYEESERKNVSAANSLSGNILT